MNQKAEKSRSSGRSQYLIKIKAFFNQLKIGLRMACEKGKVSYQPPAHGLAVTGFIFVLVSVIFWGWIPLLTFIGVSCILISLAKGNTSGVVIIGIILAVLALILAYRHAGQIGYYTANETARNAMLEETLSRAMSGLENFISRVVAKLASLAS